jgi:sterol desaturase/sphingolipid hydroxylase (fatty acid hydroxylase superfamily)
MCLSTVAQPTLRAEPTTTTTKVEPSENKPFGWGIKIQPTFWKTEQHRYSASPWLLVRCLVLFCFFQIMEKLGVFLWPKIVAMADSYAVDVRTIALPVLATMGVNVFFAYGFGYYGIIYGYLDDTYLFRKYRVHRGDWPWKVDPQGWNAKLSNTICSIIFNYTMYLPQMFMIKYVLGTPCPWRVDIETLPSATELFWQIMLFLFLEDMAVHHTHMLMHTKPFYWMHKKHHAYKCSIGVVTAYTHPFDDWIECVAPAVIGPLLLWDKMHVWTLFAWLIVGINCTVETHSGYDLPWSMYQVIPFMCTTDYHEYHHRFHNKGNYSGTLMLWDQIWGTNQNYYNWVQAGRPSAYSRDKAETEPTCEKKTL